MIKSFTNIEENDLLNLVDIDSSITNKYGISFSNEKWLLNNFKYKLPLKDELSFVFFEGNKIIGYIIASLKNESIYIHRFVVNKKGYAKEFFEKILKKYEKKPIYLMVNTININAINFYKEFSFYIINDEDMINKFIANGLKIENNEIEVGENYKCYLMKRN